VCTWNDVGTTSFYAMKILTRALTGTTWQDYVWGEGGGRRLNVWRLPPGVTLPFFTMGEMHKWWELE